MVHLAPSDGAAPRSPSSSWITPIATWTSVLVFGSLILGVLVWQGIHFAGDPDPEADGLTPTAAVLNASLIVFREGLEAVLILAALTASLARSRRGLWKPIGVGAVLSMLATVVTWFVAIAIIDFADNYFSALHVQAATGLLAIAVLLVIMNWFFHKVYWTGWIAHHNRRKKSLVGQNEAMTASVFTGLVLLGFTAIYREGFEIVLFMQTVRLRAGEASVYQGVGIGLALTAMVAVLTFIAHQRLPYKKMLVLTGVLLGVVLMVMVGEQVQEMQDAGWISTTTLEWPIPGWLGMWFAIFPNVEGLASQAVAVAYVLGSYWLARRLARSPKMASEVGGSHQDDQDIERPARAEPSLTPSHVGQT